MMFLVAPLVDAKLVPLLPLFLIGIQEEESGEYWTTGPVNYEGVHLGSVPTSNHVHTLSMRIGKLQPIKIDFGEEA